MKKKLSALFMAALILLAASGCRKDSGQGTESKASEAAESKEVFYTVEAGTKGTFYSPDEEFNLFLETEREFDGTIDDVLAILSSLGAFGKADVKANSFYFTKGDTAYIDLNKAYKEYVASGASAIVQFGIDGMALTIKSCFGVEYVRLTVDGKDLSTGHTTYDKPI